MAELLIRPVKIKTVGGYDAIVDGIDPTSRYMLRGMVTSAAGTRRRWSRSGVCRNTEAKCHLDTGDAHFGDLLKTADNLLGATPEVTNALDSALRWGARC